jgi:hypothetical protein
MTLVAGSCSYRLGTRRGLDACASVRGTLAVLAHDHRQNLRAERRPEAPETATYRDLATFKRAGTPWQTRVNSVTSMPAPGAGWYVEHGARP